MNIKRNNYDPERKKKLLYNLIGGLVGIVIGLLLSFVFYKRYGNELVNKKPIEGLHLYLLDGFSFSFIFYICMYFFAYVSYKEHFFSMLSYAFKKFGTSLLPRRAKINENMPKTYGDYLIELKAKPIPYYRWLLFDSLGLLLIAIICLIIYIANPVEIIIK